ncbi:MAG: CoB--CoM heterodisulfide reductase iron-sulfur subunit B family protein [Clostridiales bacterium]|nr:CoB--CoM heterodisulfide reductase iron-sulfur subunit B family protein [Clostridiales bacterium]
MKYSYYPGCSMEASGLEYAKSLACVNRAIGLDFIEIEDWNCCGATAGHSLSHELGLALPARNVALSAQQQPGLSIVVPCASCYSRMKYAVHAVRGAEREKLSRLIEMPLTDSAEIVSIMEAYSTPTAMEAIRAAVTKPLKGLKVACYYGCLYSRPPKITGAENIEDPQDMDELMRLIGATTVDWAFKTECCGAGHHVDLPKESKPLLYRIYKNARANGAAALVTACPMCMMNLDMRQGAVNMLYGEDFDLPVYFFTELLAVAMGASFKECGVSSHFHPAKKLLHDLISGKEVV